MYVCIMVLVHRISQCILFLRVDAVLFFVCFILYYFFSSFSLSFCIYIYIVRRRPFGMVKCLWLPKRVGYMCLNEVWKWCFYDFQYKCFAGCWSKWNVGSFHCKIHIVISRFEMQHMKWHFMSKNESKSLLVAWWKRKKKVTWKKAHPSNHFFRWRKKEIESERERECERAKKREQKIKTKITFTEK